MTGAVDFSMGLNYAPQDPDEKKGYLLLSGSILGKCLALLLPGSILIPFGWLSGTNSNYELLYFQLCYSNL